MIKLKRFTEKYIRIGLDDEKEIEKIYSYKENSFNIVRLFLAIAVIYSRCYPLMGYNLTRGDIVQRFTKNQVSFGEIAVYSFFIISGFLITQSMMNSKTYCQYLLKRVLRIFPAFLMALFFSAFLIGPLVSNINLNQYFLTSNVVEPIKFIFENFTMNIFGYSWGILGRI